MMEIAKTKGLVDLWRELGKIWTALSHVWLAIAFVSLLLALHMGFHIFGGTP